MNGKNNAENLRKAAWKLAHDVGKYASRTARNLPSGQLSSGLVRLFYEDLFETDGKRSALALFEELAKPLEEDVKDDKLSKCRELLQEVDGLRDRIGDSDEKEIRRAAAMVIEVDSLLRALAREMDEAIS